MGGGAGASSGKVAYPAYVEDIHEDWLDGNSTNISDDMTEIMNAALGNSPYTSMVPYDPTAPLADIDTEVTDFQALLDAVTIPVQLTDTEIDAEVQAYRDQTDVELISTVLPRFQAGMRDIGAVVSSAFAEGQAILEDGQSRDVNKFASSLRLKAKASAVERSGIQLQQANIKSNISSLLFNANKIRITAEKTELDQEYSFDIGDAKWDLEVFQHGANLLAAPGGASQNTKSLPGDPIGMLMGSVMMG